MVHVCHYINVLSTYNGHLYGNIQLPASKFPNAEGIIYERIMRFVSFASRFVWPRNV